MRISKCGLTVEAMDEAAFLSLVQQVAARAYRSRLAELEPDPEYLVEVAKEAELGELVVPWQTVGGFLDELGAEIAAGIRAWAPFEGDELGIATT